MFSIWQNCAKLIGEKCLIGAFDSFEGLILSVNYHLGDPIEFSFKVLQFMDFYFLEMRW